MSELKIEENVEILLKVLLVTESDRSLWMSGFNHAFGMAPAKMLEEGRGDEVLNYLRYMIEGPY